MSNGNLQDYNEVLSTISTCLSQYNSEYCVIAGDFNTDFSYVLVSVSPLLFCHNFYREYVCQFWNYIILLIYILYVTHY